MSAEVFSLLHPGIQEVVWKMGWSDFKPIQAKAIRTITETQKHLVICAPTAGGKTEAAFLPIISKLAANPQPSVQALYVGPLKALINDQFRRLEDLCGELEIPVHRWHGDVTASKKKALRDNPSGILLITPESLESNFINFGQKVPLVYRNLSFVVIDELHSFMDGVRGVHLQSLISRLKSISGCSPRMVGLSATIANPHTASVFLSPDDPKSVELIDDESAKREIRFGVRTYLKEPPQEDGDPVEPRLTAEQALALADKLEGPNDVHAKAVRAWICKNVELVQPSEKRRDEMDEIADDVLKNFQISTNLIFGNRKDAIEDLADRLHERVREEKLPADPFVVHHGSLSKDLREEAEAALKSGVSTTALCSSTLEMGIDIGYVKAVGQVDTPWTVSSMVQRLGRSGRRPGEPAIMRVYVREKSPHQETDLTELLYPDLVRAIALTRLMLGKWLEPMEPNQMHLSTLIHQVLSFLKQTGGMRASNLYQALCLQGPFRNITQQQFMLLLRELGKQELLEQTPPGEIILGLLGEKITAGFDFYAAFQTPEEYVIRNGKEEIGKLSARNIPPVDQHLLLAGKRWRVLEIIPNQKLVLVEISPGKKILFFSDSEVEIHSRVLREMKEVLLGDDEPAYLDQNSILLLRAARKVARVIGLDKGDIVAGKHTVTWFPWVGTRTMRALSLLAEQEKIPHRMDRLSITYTLPSMEHLLAHLQKVVGLKPTAVALARMMKAKTAEKFDVFLPDELLDESNARSRLDTQEAFAICESLLAAARENPRTGQPIRSEK